MTTPRRNRFSLGKLAGLLALGLCTCVLAAFIARSQNAAQRQSLYLAMPDGVKIAIDIWLPANLEPGQKLPTMMRSTGYWRSYQFGPLGQVIEKLGIMPEEMNEGPRWTKAGYALVTVDVRGTGASSGQWDIPWSEQEIADLGKVVDWVVAQPWSNGRVGAYGVSYDGNTAELLATLKHPAVKAVAPQYDDFDLQAHLVLPGGVLNRGFMQAWNEFHHRLGANDVCALSLASGVDCEKMKAMLQGVRRVDDDPDGAQLAAAVAGHASPDVFEIAQRIQYRDDLYGDLGITLGATSPYSHKQEIEASGVALYVWASWLDSAMLEGALGRYLTLSNPQTLVIGPWSHSGNHHADPFLPADKDTDPSSQEQFDMLVAFFDAYLKDGAAPPPQRGITYYTLGEGAWKTTQAWPPAGFHNQRWYFGPGGSLLPEMPAAETGADDYIVDWTATTGSTNRWNTSLFMEDVIYPDRAEQDRKLLAYTSAPLPTAVEITGSPIVTLYLASTAEDGALHVYLEDVAPDGRVTYITEGILRTIHRKVSAAQPPYTQFGPYHSFARADAMPLAPGEVTEISFNLYATSVLISQGHAIRIAIAGHDASMFARYPAQGTPVLSVQRNQAYASWIDLPVMPRP